MLGEIMSYYFVLDSDDDGSSRYRNRLVQITKNAKRKPAEELAGVKECQRSGVCCWRRPCDLFSGDVERLAAHLGLTVQETFKQYLIVDQLDGKYRLLPRRGEQEGGLFLTAAQTFDIDTPCIFLDTEDNNCKVHDAKPTGGAHWSCSMSASENAALPKPKWTREDLMSLGWNGEE